MMAVNLPGHDAAVDHTIVDVVIPVYNRIHFLPATLQSVLDQTYPHWRLWVVDDGSSEDVAGMLAGFPDPRITYIRQENQGNAAARNTGIQAGVGEYVACLDSDDVWLPRMLETCIGEFENHQEADVAFVQVERIDEHGKPLAGSKASKLRSGNLLEPLLFGMPILPSSALLRRTGFRDWGSYSSGLDDWELWLRWAANGCRFHAIDQKLLLYRIHGQNFNLAMNARRAVHFATLDKFFAENEVPSHIAKAKNKVYAHQHRQFAILAWQLERESDARTEFQHAVECVPSLLSDLSFLTEIACAHQGRVAFGYRYANTFNIEKAEQALISSLDALFADRKLDASIIRQEGCAYAWAYYALTRLTYSLAKDNKHAQVFVNKSLAAWPSMRWRSAILGWQMRSHIGHGRISKLKRSFAAFSRARGGIS